MFPTLEDIAKRRRQLGLKQSELAKAAGVSQSLIAKLEAGTIDSSYTKVKTIFDVLERLEFKTKVQAEKLIHSEVISVQKRQPISEVVKVMKENGYLPASQSLTANNPSAASPKKPFCTKFWQAKI